MVLDPDAEAVLAAHGIRPGPRGYAPAQLAAAAAARGWQARAEEVPRATRWTRWRAAVRRPAAPLRQLVAQGRGPSRETALAAALAAALAEEGPGLAGD